jgi:hypothetical protein
LIPKYNPVHEATTGGGIGGAFTGRGMSAAMAGVAISAAMATKPRNDFFIGVPYWALQI